jgi:uncharacterized protein (DUF1697 family)
MALVVFMRAVNVGTHKRFSVARLARDLARHEVVNIGAAGTFVVRGPVSAAAFKAEIDRRLPFEVEMMICPAREIQDLAAAGVFEGPLPAGVQRFLAVLAKPPKTRLPLPLRHPDADTWETEVVAVHGRYVLLVTRRLGSQPVNSNLLLEKRLGLSATTRNWNTVGSVLKALEKR